MHMYIYIYIYMYIRGYGFAPDLVKIQHIAVDSKKLNMGLGRFMLVVLLL